MVPKEISHTGDCDHNQELLLVRSISTVQGESEIESFEANLKDTLPTVLEKLDKNVQLYFYNYFMSTFDTLDNVAIKEIKDYEAKYDKNKKELLEVKDVVPPAKYEELSRSLLEAKDSIIEINKGQLQRTLRLRHLFTTIFEKSMLNDEKKEPVEKVVEEEITAAVEENME